MDLTDEEIYNILDEYKIKDLKNLVREHNLHYRIPLNQKKNEIITSLIKFYRSEIIKYKDLRI